MCPTIPRNRHNANNAKYGLLREIALFFEKNGPVSQKNTLLNGIVIPRLADSKDDFVVLSCFCTWEEEHGMQILIKNGQEAPWQGTEGPWEWKTPTEFLSTKPD